VLSLSISCKQNLHISIGSLPGLLCSSVEAQDRRKVRLFG
jgi:hypothetical protein